MQSGEDCTGALPDPVEPSNPAFPGDYPERTVLDPPIVVDTAKTTMQRARLKRGDESLTHAGQAGARRDKDSATQRRCGKICLRQIAPRKLNLDARDWAHIERLVRQIGCANFCRRKFHENVDSPRQRGGKGHCFVRVTGGKTTKEKVRSSIEAPVAT